MLITYQCLSCLIGDAILVANTYTKGRSSTQGRRQLTEKITMESRYSGSTSNGKYDQVMFELYHFDHLFSTLCSAEITFKTDPKNTDYTAEHGASRNFEPWREEEAVEQEDRLAKLEEEENNPMKVLENRTTDSKREMDVLDALQDIRARNARNERVGHSVDLIAQLGMEEIEDAETAEQKRLEEEDEKLVREVFFRVSMPGSSASAPPPELLAETAETGEVQPPPIPSSSVLVKRKADDNEPSLHSLLPESTRALINTKATTINMNKKKKTDEKNSFGIKFGKKPKVKVAATL
jgi:hypothetical protein